MRKIIAVVLLLALSAASLHAAAAKRLLSFAYRKGEVRRQQVSHEQTQTLNGETQKKSIRMASEFKTILADKGDARLEMAATSCTVNGEAQPLSNELMDVDATGVTIGGHEGWEAVANTAFSETGAGPFASLIFSKSPVAVGDSWSVPQTLSALGNKFEFNTKYTYLGEAKYEGQPALKIQSASEDRRLIRVGEQEVPGRQTCEMTYWIDPVTCELLAAKGSTKFVVGDAAQFVLTDAIAYKQTLTR